MTADCVIGNGGHAKVVIDVLKAQGRYSLAGILSDHRADCPVGSHVPHLGPVDVSTVRRAGVQSAIIAIDDKAARKRIATALDASVSRVSIVHPSAAVSPSAHIGDGVLIAAGSVIQPDARIGDHAIINTLSSVDQDSTVAPCPHIASGARLAGNISVRECTLIGVGAAMIPGISIGDHGVVGAGSVMVQDIVDMHTSQAFLPSQ